MPQWTYVAILSELASAGLNTFTVLSTICYLFIYIITVFYCLSAFCEREENFCFAISLGKVDRGIGGQGFCFVLLRRPRNGKVLKSLSLITQLSFTSDRSVFLVFSGIWSTKLCILEVGGDNILYIIWRKDVGFIVVRLSTFLLISRMTFSENQLWYMLPRTLYAHRYEQSFKDTRPPIVSVPWENKTLKVWRWELHVLRKSKISHVQYIYSCYTWNVRTSIPGELYRIVVIIYEYIYWNLHESWQ